MENLGIFADVYPTCPFPKTFSAQIKKSAEINYCKSPRLPDSSENLAMFSSPEQGTAEFEQCLRKTMECIAQVCDSNVPDKTPTKPSYTTTERVRHNEDTGPIQTKRFATPPHQPYPKSRRPSASKPCQPSNLLPELCKLDNMSSGQSYTDYSKPSNEENKPQNMQDKENQHSLHLSSTASSVQLSQKVQLDPISLSIQATLSPIYLDKPSNYPTQHAQENKPTNYPSLQEHKAPGYPAHVQGNKAPSYPSQQDNKPSYPPHLENKSMHYSTQDNHNHSEEKRTQQDKQEEKRAPQYTEMENRPPPNTAPVPQTNAEHFIFPDCSPTIQKEFMLFYMEKYQEKYRRDQKQFTNSHTSPITAHPQQRASPPITAHPSNQQMPQRTSPPNQHQQPSPPNHHAPSPPINPTVHQQQRIPSPPLQQHHHQQQHIPSPPPHPPHTDKQPPPQYQPENCQGGVPLTDHQRLPISDLHQFRNQSGLPTQHDNNNKNSFIPGHLPQNLPHMEPSQRLSLAAVPRPQSKSSESNPQYDTPDPDKVPVMIKREKEDPPFYPPHLNPSNYMTGPVLSPKFGTGYHPQYSNYSGPFPGSPTPSPNPTTPIMGPSLDATLAPSPMTQLENLRKGYPSLQNQNLFQGLPDNWLEKLKPPPQSAPPYSTAETRHFPAHLMQSFSQHNTGTAQDYGTDDKAIPDNLAATYVGPPLPLSQQYPTQLPLGYPHHQEKHNFSLKHAMGRILNRHTKQHVQESPGSGKRTKFSSEQLRLLDHYYINVSKYVTGQGKHTLCTLTGLELSTVLMWFQNRRAREKKSKEKSSTQV